MRKRRGVASLQSRCVYIVWFRVRRNLDQTPFSNYLFTQVHVTSVHKCMSSTNSFYVLKGRGKTRPP